MLTFQEAREKHLNALKEYHQQLLNLAADPEWTNLQYPPFERVCDDINRALKKIAALNAAQLEANRD